MDLVFRRARAKDAPCLADICLLADGGTFEFLLDGLGGGKSVREKLAALCGTEDTAYSFKRFTLAESGGVVVGGFNGIPAVELSRLDDNLVGAMQRVVGLGVGDMLRWFLRRLRLAVRSKTLKLPEDCLLIANLAVFPEYRGRGVGRELIERAVADVKGGRHRSLCLFVWEDRTEAIGFYERMGFKTRSAVRFRPHRLLPHRGRRVMELRGGA
jgi:ribosomal protein S18 acetylase RimI-like enzyme